MSFKIFSNPNNRVFNNYNNEENYFKKLLKKIIRFIKLRENILSSLFFIYELRIINLISKNNFNNS
jgi:hypothetical protein